MRDGSLPDTLGLLIMISLRRALLVFALVLWSAGPRLVAQEALEIRADQDSSTEPTPIPERTREPKPPAEGTDAEATATPAKKKGPVKNVQEMSPDEFKKAGLDKLSPDELRTLNEWLKGYRAAAEQKAAAQVSEQTK